MSHDTPLVSVIIRSMARPTLADALNSLAQQTYPRLEGVVVNALGPGHPPVPSQCGPFPLRFVDYGRPLERSAAANAGLKAASGRYLGFLDDDDVLFPEHVAVLVKALQEPPAVQVAYSGVRMIAYQAEGIPCFETVFNQPFHLPSLRAQNYIPIHAVLFDRTLWEAGCQFDERLTHYEDWDFWLQLAQHSTFRHVDRVTAHYRNFGHSGFGFGKQADAARIAAGRAALFEKWRTLWSGADLSEAFTALQEGPIHRSSQTLCPLCRSKSSLPHEENTPLPPSSVSRSTGGEEGRILRLPSTAYLLEEEENTPPHGEENPRVRGNETLLEENIPFREALKKQDNLLNLPGEGLFPSAGSLTSRTSNWWASARVVQRITLRAWQVVRTEGLRTLVKRIRRRLRSTALTFPIRPQVLTLVAPFTPIAFPEENIPEISIIIPVHNQFAFTHHCLAALAAHTPSTSRFEIIVVDDGSHDGTVAALTHYAGIHLLVNPHNQGFLASVNRAAATARGRYLVILNNDTQVQPGWLDALIDTFNTFPDAGLVGSCLLYPDGRLQEAGGIVFTDGSAWNYGHLDDPNKPQYQYVREPDYVSGAALAIRREVFTQLGGFDTHFAPAYYEDVDLAFRARAAGYRVLYQPRSRVVHFEGVSLGTNEHQMGSGKAFQALHRQRFVERWQAVLATHGRRGEDLERQKERRAQRRVLVIDVYMLAPDREAGSLRLFYLLILLQELGCKITFAAANLEAPEPYVALLQRRGIEVLYPPYVRSINRHLRARGADYDLVILSRADAATRFMSAARRYCSRARIVYDTVDLHFLREQRAAALYGDAAARALAEQRRRQELTLIAQADVTLVVSTVEQELLGRIAPQANVRVVSSLHPTICGCRQPFAERQGLLFIGAFVHSPNVDALLWFYQEIFPHVLKHVPEMHLTVIGADPPPVITALASEQVRILGHVPEVAPFFDHCRLSIAPLRYGAGVKGKIIQSLAYGLPVVATTLAVEGMFLENETSVLIADDPLTFAHHIVRLYHDPVLWERVSRSGLAVLEQHFSFAAARQALIELVGQ